MCRKIYDEDKVKERQKKLTEFHNERVGEDFYDQMDYEEEDEDSEDEEIYDPEDDEWIPTKFFMEEQTITPQMITRAFARLA